MKPQVTVGLGARKKKMKKKLRMRERTWRRRRSTVAGELARQDKPIHSPKWVPECKCWWAVSFGVVCGVVAGWFGSSGDLIAAFIVWDGLVSVCEMVVQQWYWWVVCLDHWSWWIDSLPHNVPLLRCAHLFCHVCLVIISYLYSRLVSFCLSCVSSCL